MIRAALVAAFFLLTSFVSPSWAWTPAGPWGGVIHDLENRSAGSDTLFAATGNGIYQYPNGGPSGYLWGEFPSTLGMRVFEIVPDPANNRIFAIAVPSSEPFNFGQSQEYLPPSGSLYMLSTSSGMWTDLSLPDVTTIALNGSGDLLAGTWPGELYLYSGTTVSQITTIPLAGTPFRDIMAVPGTSEMYLVQGKYIDQFTSTCRVYRSTDGGSSWNTTPDLSLNDGVCLTMGVDHNGNPLLGFEDGRVWQRSPGTDPWSPYGYGLPQDPDNPYRVIGFGTDPGNNTFAVLRNHDWYDIISNPGPAGIYRMPSSSSGTWVWWNTGLVSTRIKTVIEAAGHLWIAFDQAGIHRVASGNLSALPGQAADEGIQAVSLKGIHLDPRNSERVLAFGPSGVYERRKGTWERLLLTNFENPPNSLVTQWLREDGFSSGGFSQDDEAVLWLAGFHTGILRAEQSPAGSFTYQWRCVQGCTWNGININDVEIDPFDSSSVMWAWDYGIYLTTDDGITVTPGTITHDGQTLTLRVLDIAYDYLEPSWRSYLAGIYNLTSTRPGLLFSENSLDWGATMYEGMSVYSVGFNPMAMPGSGAPRAMAGASYRSSPQRISLVKNSGWEQDTSVNPPVLNDPRFESIAFPFGDDQDMRQDVFAVISNSVHGIYWSSANADYGAPGENWTDISGEPGPGVLQDLTPMAVKVDPKDGNLLWAATGEGSAYTLLRDHFDDSTPPLFSVHPSLPQGIKMGCIGSQANTLYTAWLAPGDDGDLPGWADRYELRCADRVFLSGDDFAAFGTVVSVKAPGIAHREEIVPVDFSNCSVPGATVAFALRAIDEKGHSSEILTTGLLIPIPRMPVENLTFSLGSTQVNLQWDVSGLSGDPYYQGYGGIVIERTFEGSKVQVASLPPSTEQWTDSGADVGGFEAGDTVFYSVRAADGAGNQAAQLLVVDISTQGSSGGGGGGGCFIAAASYGSTMEPEVERFRSYRDEFLAKRWWGRALLKTYYTLSPAPAGIIADQPFLRSVSRTLLAPILWTLDIAGNGSAAPAFAGLTVLIMVLTILAFLLYILVLGIRKRVFSADYFQKM